MALAYKSMEDKKPAADEKKPDDKKPEPKTGGDGKEAKTEKKTEAAPKPAEDKVTADVDAAAAGPDMAAKHADARKALHATHKAERRDMNGRHRDEHSQMEKRHEDAIEAMNKAHDLEMVGNAPAADPAAAAPVADANVAAGNEAAA